MMALVFWTLLAVWAVGFVAMMGRLWQYRIALVKNVVPGRDPFDMRGDFFFDTTRFTPAGKEIHRETMRFFSWPSPSAARLCSAFWQA